MTSLMTSPGQSKFELAISPSIFQLERWSKAQNIGNAPGYFAGIINFRHYFWWKSLLRPQNGGHFQKIKYETQLHFDIRYEKIVPNYAKNVCFLVMTSSMTSHDCVKFGPLYLCLVLARPETMWQGQCLVNTCEYRNGLSMLYTPKEDLNK